MGKYSKELVKEVERRHDFKEKQKSLKEKYQVKEDVVIIEKNNLFKFLINTVIRLWKAILTTILLVLALVGTLALLYPAPRAAILQIFQEVWKQIITFF